jgi:phage recombination protein Bet
MATPTKDIAVRSEGALALGTGQVEWTDAQRAALVQLGLDEAPEGDLAVFLHQCQRTGLDPFLRQIYLIGRWDHEARRKKYTIQTGIDGFRVNAERTGLYGGQTNPQWCGEDGIWRDVWASEKPLVAARVGIIRKGWDTPAYGIAHFTEYAGVAKEGHLTRMWKTMPANQLAKCAEALGFRKAFPERLSGVYTADELEHLDNPHFQEPPAAPVKPAQQDIDWDAKIAEAAGNPDALRDLWLLAKGVAPNNLELAERLAAAGKAAKQAARDAAEAADVHDAEVVEDDQPTPGEMATDKQLTVIAAALGEHGVKDRDLRLAVISLLVGDRIASMKDLMRTEARLVLDSIGRLARDGKFAATITSARASLPAEAAAEVPA